MALLSRTKRARVLFGVSIMVVFSLLLGGCAGMPDMSELPFVGSFFAPEAPPTPTPQPTPTNTPEPTATPKPGETPIPATATPVATPQVTIPDGYTVVTDDERGYSFAIPRGWTPLDLRGTQFQNLANTFGAGAALEPLNDFLDSEEGKMLGALYIADISKALFGGLPSVLNVFVLDAPGYTAETAQGLVQGMIDANASALGDVTIEALNTCVVNNLQAVCGTATANLASFGFPGELFAKVTALVANDKIYILTLGTQLADRGTKEPDFDMIIGTFRPE